MKTIRLTKLIAAVLGLAAFSTAANAMAETLASAILPPRRAVITIAVMDVKPVPTTSLQATVAPGPDVAFARWIDIKDCTYDMRAQFFVGLDRLEARVDDQVKILAAKRAAMKSTTDTREWDFAMKEMDSARTSLKSIHAEMTKATPETWGQEKDRAGQAWVRTQTAFANVKSSTTT